MGRGQPKLRSPYPCIPAQGVSPSRFQSNVSPRSPRPGRVSQHVSRTTAAATPAGTRAWSSPRGAEGWQMGKVRTNMCVGSSLHLHLPLF